MTNGIVLAHQFLVLFVDKALPISLILTLAACGEELSGKLHTDPLFARSALSQFEPTDRAYVMGHAFAIYLYSRALPQYIQGSGFSYDPGVSSRFARVPYDLVEVINLDFPLYQVRGVEGVGDGSAGDNLPGGGEPAGEAEDSEGRAEPSDAGEIQDPAVECESRRRGKREGRHGVTDERGCYIDHDCETFLDPPAIDAREAAEELPPEELIDEQMDDASLEETVDFFVQGLKEAMALEDLGENTDFSEPEGMKERVQDAGMCDHSPIVLDLGGDGIQASSPERGVIFDLRGNGVMLRTSWPEKGDALLAIDWNRNGRIDNGRELFGNNLGYANGFASLSRLDAKKSGGNENGKVDQGDALFRSLLLWQDKNRDGKSQREELTSIRHTKIDSINLAHKISAATDNNGNHLRLQGTFVVEGDDGALRSLPAVDVWFRIQNAARAPSLLSLVRLRK